MRTYTYRCVAGGKEKPLKVREIRKNNKIVAFSKILAFELSHGQHEFEEPALPHLGCFSVHHCKRKTPVTSRYTRKMSECTGRLPEFQECTGGLPDFFYIT